MWIASRPVARRWRRSVQPGGAPRVRARDPQQADRVIARKANVSKQFVGTTRQAGEKSGEVVAATTVIGADGVAQPAKRKYTRRFNERSTR